MDLTSALSYLRCPVSATELTLEGDELVSRAGQRYPIVQGVPVLLAETNDPTLWVVKASYDSARSKPPDPYHEDTLGCSPDELRRLRERLAVAEESPVDPVVSFMIGATSGYMYEHLVGGVKQLPIPDLRLPAGDGKRLLDIGCNWGRWSIAAARKGYLVFGVDPSLGAVLAARRTAAKLGLDATFVVGDALKLPFAPGSFDQIFSYSVIQHFSKENAEIALREAARVSRPGADLLIQMPNKLGIRCQQHMLQRGYREPKGFEVRYYFPGELVRLFERAYGPSKLEVDGYFGLGIQPADRHLLSGSKRLVIDTSEGLRQISLALPPLRYLADSLYVSSRRRAA